MRLPYLIPQKQLQLKAFSVLAVEVAIIITASGGKEGRKKAVADTFRD